MSVAAAGLEVCSIPGGGQSSPCFAFPLIDRASSRDIEKATLLKVIESEYAAKYLEFLGANPTQAAQDLVRKALPLTTECLQTKLKASGHRHNEVLVTPPALQYDMLPVHEADPQEVVRLGFIGTLNPAEVKAADDAQNADGEYRIVSRTFTDVAAAFLDPTRKSGSKHSSQHQHLNSAGIRQSFEQKAGRVGVYCHLNHMQRELARPFKALPASLKRIQLHFGQSVSEWYNALPRAAKRGHGQLKEKDVQSTTDELVSEAVISLAVNTVTYLYHEYVLSAPAFPSDQLATVVLPQDKLLSQKSVLSRGGSILSCRQSLLASQMSMPGSQSPSRQQSLQPLPSRGSAAPASTAADLAAAAAVQIEGQRTRLLSIVQLWAQCSRAYSGSRWQTSFARPVVILSLRALVEKVFTDAFPVWASSGQGADRLKSMDAQLLEWFDPHGFNSSISLLQSLHTAGQHSQDSPAAQRTVQHRRREFTGTTSLVTTFFTEPKTAACRRLKSHSGTENLEDHNSGAELTQRQKGTLFKSAERLLLREY